MQEIPRAPYRDASNKEALLSDSVREQYESKMRSYKSVLREEAFRTARSSPEFSNVNKYVSYLEGNQLSGSRKKHRSRFVDNRIEAARRDKLALLSDSRPSICVQTNVDAMKETAGVIEKVLQSEWLTQDMDLSLVSAVDIGMLWGTAFWKIGAASPGSMKLIPCGPDQVLPIQPGFHIQESFAILYRTWKPINYFRKVFPMRADKIRLGNDHIPQVSDSSAEYSQPEEMSGHTWNALAPNLQRLFGGKVAPSINGWNFGGIELEEYYIDDTTINDSNKTVIVADPYLPLDQHNWWYEVKPRERLYPRKRLVVFANNEIMYDGPNPYWHGLYPFACLRLNPVPWSFYGLSSYRSLLPMQQAMNDIGAGIMDMISRNLFPVLISKTSAVVASTWNAFQQDKPGEKLLLGPLGNPASDIQYAQTPVLQPYVYEMLANYISPQMDRISGIVDVAGMSRKNQVPGGDTLEQMRDSLQMPIKLEERYLEAFLRDAGIQAVSNVIQFYNTRQRMYLLGEDGITMQDFEFNGDNLIPESERDESYWKNYTFKVIPGSLRGDAKQSKIIEASSLAKMGLTSIPELLRVMGKDPGDITNIMQELAAQAQAGIGQGATGRGPRTASQKNG